MNVGPTLIAARRFEDARGWFAETWSAARLAEAGIDCAFVQDNQSFSARAGTVRGLHFQAPPRAQAKLVRCLRGAIRDHVVDIRKGSPTFGRRLSVTLDAAEGASLFVPAGLAHGFVTLTDETEVAYKVSDLHAPELEGGLAWDDPALGLDRPLTGEAILSDRDRAWPTLAALDSPFADDGVPFVLKRIEA